MKYITKKISGKTFRKRRAFNKKSDAQKMAKMMRKRGMQVRVLPIKEKGKKRYCIYFRNP